MTSITSGVGIANIRNFLRKVESRVVKSIFSKTMSIEGGCVKGFRIIISIIGIVFSYQVFSSTVNLPQEDCKDHGKLISVMNEQALKWKSEVNGFHARALISGTVDEVFPDHSGHRHFSLKIGPNNEDHIEVIYNESFGAMPLAQVGDSAEACGDYIVSSQQTGGYPASPDGAIVHWVHKSPHASHDDGFVVLNGILYGNGNGSGN